MSEMPIESLQIRDTEAARLAGVSRATWRRLYAAAKTPSGIKLGGCRLWNRAVVISWIDAGCPDRRTWLAMQAQSRRYARAVN
jgi:predicted DNA-binding transcriptional regulator AlpA